MKGVLKVLFSNKLTLVALAIFAISMAYATFMENDYGTPVARTAIYEAWWFEVVMLVLVINFVGNIFRYKLLRKEKLGLFVFHIAFIVILAGAFITRYTGQEGLMRIREGQSSNHILSQERFLNIHVKNQDEDWSLSKEMKLTQFHQPHINTDVDLNNSPLNITVERFVPNAVQGLIEEKDSEVLEIVAAIDQQRTSYYLDHEGSIFIKGHEITFNKAKEGAINIEGRAGQYSILASEDFNYMVMSTQESGRLAKDQKDTLQLRALYQSEHLNFVVSNAHIDRALDFTTTNNKEEAQNAADLLFVNFITANEHRRIILAALDGVYSPQQNVQLQDYEISLSYGPRLIELPFALHLRDFQLERYPGSVSPSSYASELTLEDGDLSTDIRISMNNVLDHRGYRFFQASYDLDELGTVLSVNRDYWGTLVTYLGYLLMGLGMFMTLFSKASRFNQISKKLKKLQTQKRAIASILLLLLSSLSLNAQTENTAVKTDSIPVPVSEEHATLFGELLVQDMDGRIKPINTLASEFLRKLTRKTHYTLIRGNAEEKYTADQIFLSVHQNPEQWQFMPLIKVDEKKGAFMLEMLGLPGQSLISFRDLIADNGEYFLQANVQEVQRKKPAARSESEKELLNVDERFNILYQALTGNYLKIFPQPDSPENNWYNQQFFNAGFNAEDSLFVRNILSFYYQDLAQASQNNDYSAALDKLIYIKTFQETMGESVLPEEGRIKAELLYNKLNIFNRLFPIYWMLGIYLIVLSVLRVFFQTRTLKIAYNLGVIITAIAFLMQTGNMILRWYAADYPPWSNGYEMIIMVAWALFLFGFIFYKRSDFVLPLVTLFGGTLLFVSYLDWLNPEITTLVPVLKSYWLKIHVAIIVSSYAPLALSALLGLLALIFMIINKSRFKTSITELTYINELSMTIGIFLLAIGTFLGGVWANESWGRYWGWDPKETWALISIIVYAVILHLRLVPKLRGEYTFSLASVIGFFSIIMTSFGVNYYLSGLHSYAAGDPLPIPSFVYWVVGLIFVVAFGAYFRNKSSAAIGQGALQV